MLRAAELDPGHELVPDRRLEDREVAAIAVRALGPPAGRPGRSPGCPPTRSISLTARSGYCGVTAIDARRRGSLSSHSAISQSLTALATAAAPYGLRMPSTA